MIMNIREMIQYNFIPIFRVIMSHGQYWNTVKRYKPCFGPGFFAIECENVAPEKLICQLIEKSKHTSLDENISA